MEKHTNITIIDSKTQIHPAYKEGLVQLVTYDLKLKNKIKKVLQLESIGQIGLPLKEKDTFSAYQIYTIYLIKKEDLNKIGITWTL